VIDMSPISIRSPSAGTPISRTFVIQRATRSPLALRPVRSWFPELTTSWVRSFKRRRYFRMTTTCSSTLAIAER
jgi:hypothetical protein